ncbi:MAG: hypothetical protein FWH05_08280 [Oscillospiraceae bacterium]|nr:hypothetical protein [Oscillospiraceae bacterium]
MKKSWFKRIMALVTAAAVSIGIATFAISANETVVISIEEVNAPANATDVEVKVTATNLAANGGLFNGGLRFVIPDGLTLKGFRNAPGNGDDASHNVATRLAMMIPAVPYSGTDLLTLVFDVDPGASIGDEFVIGMAPNGTEFIRGDNFEFMVLDFTDLGKITIAEEIVFTQPLVFSGNLGDSYAAILAGGLKSGSVTPAGGTWDFALGIAPVGTPGGGTHPIELTYTTLSGTSADITAQFEVAKKTVNATLNPATVEVVNTESPADVISKFTASIPMGELVSGFAPPQMQFETNYTRGARPGRYNITVSTADRNYNVNLTNGTGAVIATAPSTEEDDPGEGGGGSGPGGSGGRGGGGGGGGAIGSSTAAARTTQGATVTSRSAQNAIASATARALASGTRQNITFVNAGTFTADAARQIVAANASNSNISTRVFNDTRTATGAFDARIILDVTKVTRNLNVYASTLDARATAIKAHFSKFFSNNFVVVNMGETGSFDQDVTVVVRVGRGVKGSDIRVMAFNPATNRTTLNADANPRVDKNGFVHFTVNRGAVYVLTTDGNIKR